MSDMEHMGERWEAVFDNPDWCIRSQTEKRWLAQAVRYISTSDPTGERTARAIVDAHNAALHAPTATLETTHPDRRAVRQVQAVPEAPKPAATFREAHAREIVIAGLGMGLTEAIGKAVNSPSGITIAEVMIALAEQMRRWAREQHKENLAGDPVGVKEWGAE